MLEVHDTTPGLRGRDVLAPMAPTAQRNDGLLDELGHGGRARGPGSLRSPRRGSVDELPERKRDSTSLLGADARRRRGSAARSRPFAHDRHRWPRTGVRITPRPCETVMAPSSGTPIQTRTLIFSVHMYQVYEMGSVVTSARYQHLPLEQQRSAAHRGRICGGPRVRKVASTKGRSMSTAEMLGIGYLGWSWSGNSEDLVSLDMTLDFRLPAI